jgi:acyl-homoserine lactone acylase PvdQ
VSRLPLVFVVLAMLVAAPGALAASGDTSRYVLTPGNYGGIPTTDQSRDQLPLYSGLTPLRRNVGFDDLQRLFLPMDFKPVGQTRVEPVPRTDVTITYDAHGIPHIKGQTRAGLMYGAGWVMGRDRNLLFTFGRNPARAAVADIPGLDAFSLVTSATPYEPSAEVEALVTRQRQDIVDTYGDEGRQMLRDFEDYAAGINGFYEAPGGPPPPAKPFDANDAIAVTAFIGSIFGAGGGSEYRNADLLAKLQERLGNRRGRAAWNDAMLSVDPESPTTTRRHFRYGPLTGGPVRGSVVLDPDSVELVPDPRTPGVAGTEAPRRQMSNWLQVAPRRSATGNTLGVMGPQLGYFYPEIVYQEHLEGPGINAQGIAVSGLGLYMLIGRTQDYAWSLTSAGHDNRDVFAEKLCEPDGSEPTRASTHYVFRGVCRPMETFNAGTLAGRPVIFHKTVHGSVIGTATVDRRPYALARKRSTFGHDGLNLGALKAMTEGRATTPRRFWTFANRFGFTFNWGYTSRTATSYFSSGLLPKRARGLDRRLPTLGTGDYEWRGFLREREHPHDISGRDGLLLSWNNQSAPGFMHGDDEHYGSVDRVEMFDGWPRRARVTDVVGIMNKAATQDVIGSQVWPVIRAVLNRGTAPDALTARAAALVDQWSSAGSPLLGDPPGGPIPFPGAAVMARSWPRISDAVLEPVLGPVMADLVSVVGRPGGLADKDLRTLLRRHVRGRFALRYCGGGDLERCASSLWAALKAGVDELVAQQGTDPSAWRISQGTTGFVPGLIPDRFPSTNRPTYQQVLEFAR